jgi:hypothetical protein
LRSGFSERNDQKANGVDFARSRKSIEGTLRSLTHLDQAGYVINLSDEDVAALILCLDKKEALSIRSTGLFLQHIFASTLNII